MTQCISIGTTQHIDILKEKLKNKFNMIKGNTNLINLEENSAGKITFLDCNIKDWAISGTEENNKFFRYNIANIISDLILENWEKLLIREIIRESYYYFNEEEKSTILQYTIQYIYNEHEYNYSELIARKKDISNKLLDYLMQNDSIVIDGFIKFRLKEYMNELRETVDRAVDDFLMEREYKEFIQLLRYFVEIQEPHMETLNILIQPNGYFKLYDDKLEVISNEYLEGYLIDIADSEINYEDLLISILISIAPRNIVFHVSQEDNDKAIATLDTIKNVFVGRVSKCPGCKICRQN